MAIDRPHDRVGAKQSGLLARFLAIVDFTVEDQNGLSVVVENGCAPDTRSMIFSRTAPRDTSSDS
jgi:hypothetical protein